jgi:hypothetical protein
MGRYNFHAQWSLPIIRDRIEIEDQRFNEEELSYGIPL